MRRFCDRLSFVAFLACSFALSPAAHAGNGTAKPQDEIEVIGHISLTGGPIRHLLNTEHYSSYYLYAERDGNRVTLIDVTKAAQPSVLADVMYPPHVGSAGLLTVAGTAALITSEQETATTAIKPQTIRIIDFSDSQSPKVIREFTGVTATCRDDRRGLVFVANAEGVWILHQSFAEDPEVEQAYAHHVLYER
jgi:hypothetical protein